MGVSTFNQPDNTAQDAATYKAAIDGSISVVKRIGQVYAPHEQSIPDMTVRLDAGFVWDSVTLTEVAAQNSPTITAPTTNPRIDRVVVDIDTGTAEVVTGTEAPSPSAPTIPANKVPVAQVSLVVSQTQIVNNDLTDERVFPSKLKGIFGGTGDDGAATIAVDTTINGIKNYTSLTIDAGKILDHDAERALILKVSGVLTVNGLIDVTGKGLPGAAKGNPGAPGSGDGIAGGGGGGGDAGSVIGGDGGNIVYGRGGGGNGGIGSAGVGAAAPTVFSDLIGWSGQPPVAAGAGGGGGGQSSGTGGDGGRGGGVLVIEADTIIVGAAGIIRANGAAGANATASAAGGGGGGGGGTIILRYRTLINNGTIEALGGAGGSKPTTGANGAVGGAGLLIQEKLP